VAEADVGVAEIVFGGLLSDVVDDGGEVRALCREAAL